MKIFSKNEWDPLKEVIVGNIFEDYTFNIDLSFKLFFQDNYGWGFRVADKEIVKVKEKHIFELKEDIDELVKTLKQESIKVHRPNKLSKVIKRDNGNDWSSEMIPALNVRDQSIIIDDTIVETSPCQRCRYYENELLQDIFAQSNSKHLKMPKSKMLDENFDQDLLKKRAKINNEQREVKTFEAELLMIDESEIKNHIDPNIEMMIDGANCVRFGDDIIINVANRNQYLGYLWFKEHFPNKKWHVMHAISNNHLDSFIVPICEGVLLLRDPKIQLPEFLKDWKIIIPPEPTQTQFPTYDSNDIIVTSPYIDMNVLSLDGNKIITNSLFPELSELLYKEGFDPIPVQHRHRRIFGGGFHCFTLDLLRETNERTKNR